MVDVKILEENDAFSGVMEPVPVEPVHPLLDDLRVLRADVAKLQKSAYHRETIEKLWQLYLDQREMPDEMVDDWMREREPWVFEKTAVDEVMAAAEEVRGRFAKVRDKVSTFRKNFKFSNLFKGDKEDEA